MKKQLYLLMICLPVMVMAQSSKDEKGIQWTTGLSWQQVKEKAKTEGKYIFVDCYATWCAPCKAMDKGVYTNDKVGKQMNDKFISIKVQMDKTEDDNEMVKLWHKDAQNLVTLYSLQAFPSFLFFDSNGMPVHKDVGYRNVEQFISLVQDAQNPEKQYYTLFNQFEPGKIDLMLLKERARSFLTSGKELAYKMAYDYLTRIPSGQLNEIDNLYLMLQCRESKQVQDIAAKVLSDLPAKELSKKKYMQVIGYFINVPAVTDLVLNYLKGLGEKAWIDSNNIVLLGHVKASTEAKPIANGYLNSLTEKDIFTAKTLRFISDFTSKSSDKYFNLFYRNARKVDTVVGYKGFAQFVTDKIIINEEINSITEQVKENVNDDVNWKALKRQIRKKYDARSALRCVISAATLFYDYRRLKYNRNWSEYIKNSLLYYDKVLIDPKNEGRAFNVNNLCYDVVFFHCENRKLIKKAIRLMSEIVEKSPHDHPCIDTYASLLYKIGKRRKAILLEQRAYQLAIEQKSDFGIRMYANVIGKMKAGDAIWIKYE